jgi:hypothetical protein
VPLVLVPSFLKIHANQIVSVIMLWICTGVKSEKSNMVIEFFSLFCDVRVLNIFKYVPLHAQVPDTALVSGGNGGMNPRHVVRNFFLLKLVTLLEDI